MRLLLDNNLSPRLASTLAESGFDVRHVRDYGLECAADDAVMELALQEKRILVSADTDFGQLLAQSRADGPSLVLIRRISGRRVEAVAELISSNLPSIADDLACGCVVVLLEESMRIRRLPIV